jgi:outer membrane protein TolC
VGVLALLGKPLDAVGGVAIAIANNRGLQARYAELGIAAAGVAEATVLRPTEVDLSYKVGITAQGSEIEIDVIQDVLDLITIPKRRGAAKAELEAARARTVAATIDLAARVELAFYDAVGALQTVALRQTSFDAAEASATVAERMHAAGGANDLMLARERDRREQARLDLGRAQRDVELAREALGELLGVSGDDTRFTTIERLPDPPTLSPSLDGLERDAIAASLELAAIRADAGAAADRLGLARLRSWLPELGLGVSVLEHDDAWGAGPAVRIGLPIFDQNQGARAEARAELSRARHRATDVAVATRARARAARIAVLEAHAAARHLRDVVVPLRQTIVAETLKHYNAMNASPFELLSARRELVDADRQYIDAVRGYWRAATAARALSRGALIDAGHGGRSERGDTADEDDHR